MARKRRPRGGANRQVAAAVGHFWTTRLRQGQAQGRRSGQRDYGHRTHATGGKQFDGFSKMVADLLTEARIPPGCIFHKGRENVTLPGFFRPSKQWDVLVVAAGHLLAAIEFKALCGPSFGNNYNNRVEEALGSSHDIWTAYREGAFDSSPQPFLGYLLLVEEAAGSVCQVGVFEQHIPVFNEYRDASYIERCGHSLQRLIRERCYTTACLITSTRSGGASGYYREPIDELRCEPFARLMCGHVSANYQAIRAEPT